MKGKQKGLIITIAIIFFALLFINKIANFIVNIEWYSEVKYLSIYFTKLLAVLKLMIPIFLVIFGAIYFYYRSLRKSIRAYVNNGVVDVVSRKKENKIFLWVNLLLSLILSYAIAGSYWYSILQFENSVPFGVLDPIFSLDVSFYVFKLPLIESIYGTLMSILVFLIIITLISYFILRWKDNLFNIRKPIPNINIRDFKSGITKFAGRQLSVVAALIMLLLSIGYIIKSLNLVYSPRGVVFGAGYTDTHVTLVFFIISAVVSLMAAFIVFISLQKSKVKPIIISIAVMVALVIVEGIGSQLVQSLYVKSNERRLEQPYIKNNIEYTRKAFNIENAQIDNFTVQDNLTPQDITDNKDTVDNIKINSFKPALEFYNQVQMIRYYYGFNDLDVDRYNINGKYSQVFVAPREISTDSLDEKASTWQNKHLIYTHGYGVVMSKVNSVTSEGQPDFVIKDIPSDNDTDIKVDNPRIYFGEKTNDYSIVNTSLKEFDYPKGGDNETNNYNGSAGIKMSPINKLIYAVNEQDMNFLLSTDIKSSSKILINRNIMDRVKKIAPFLTYDSDPYVVISNGRLVWIIDAYTSSDRYPYSQPYNDINYIRNSIKITVDAYNGDTNFYVYDTKDPIAVSLKKIFPSLFKDKSQIPKDIQEHFRYPEDLFNIQCQVMGKYHVTDPSVFFGSEDLWEVSTNQKEVGGEKAVNDSSYVFMNLPQEKKEEMVLLEYFNMRNKDNMVAMFGARMDGDNYGKLILYKFPPQKTIYSPYMFKQRLNQDTTISKELSLWNKDGSKVQFGDTVIVPIKNSLLYVEPMYLRADGKQSIPEMKRVIVSYGDKIVISESMDKALAELFNLNNVANGEVTKPQETTTPTENVPSDYKEKLKAAKDYYDKAIEAQKAGDWATYGDNIKKLSDILEELNK